MGLVADNSCYSSACLHLVCYVMVLTGENDFNTTPFVVTFPADEGLPSPKQTVPAPIPVFDDEIDEAVHQSFIAYLEILDAVNSDLITIRRDVGICNILDNDGERNSYSNIAVWTTSVSDTLIVRWLSDLFY